MVVSNILLTNEINVNQIISPVIEFSIVMPCLNEEKTIGECINRSIESLKRLKKPFEVIISDNGSSDRSPDIAISRGAKLIHTKERGYGNACNNGIRHADGKYIFLLDSDLTYDPNEFPLLIKKIKKTGADIVTGSRIRGKIEKGAMPWYHRFIGNPVLTLIMNILYGTRITDSHCGMRVIKKDAYKKLRLNASGMEFASEMLVKAALLKMKIKEVPIAYYKRPEGSISKLHSFRDGYRHIKYLLRTWAVTRFEK